MISLAQVERYPAAILTPIVGGGGRPKYAHCSRTFKRRYFNVFTSNKFEISTKEAGVYTNHVRTCCGS